MKNPIIMERKTFDDALSSMGMSSRIDLLVQMRNLLTEEINNLVKQFEESNINTDEMQYLVNGLKPQQVRELEEKIEHEYEGVS